MRRFSLLPAATLAGVLLLGCVDQHSPTAPADPLGGSPPSLRTDKDPGNLGAIVIRGPQFAAFTSDPAGAGFPPPNITVMIGWTFDQLLDFCATGEPTLSDLEQLIVIRPHSTQIPDWKLLIHASQSPMLVWETAIPFIDPFGELCNLALNVPHLTGTGESISTDNDFFVTGTRADAHQDEIHGEVTSESGQRYRVAGFTHILVLPSGELSFTGDLDLIPIGQ